jgi:hypothetical protein
MTGLDMSGAAEIIVAGTREVFIADECTVEVGAVHARGRWRTRWGPNSSRSSYSEPLARTWPVQRVEIRWAQVAA